MKEKEREIFRGVFFRGCAARLRHSKAIIRSTQPAGRFSLNESMNSEPKMSHNNFSNSRSTPTSKSYNNHTYYIRLVYFLEHNFLNILKRSQMIFLINLLSLPFPFHPSHFLSFSPPLSFSHRWIRTVLLSLCAVP